MFLYGLLLTIFIINCLLLILLVLIQKSKSSAGIGNMGGGAQLLFGGSGGQDILQKITWTMGAIFMGGSLVLGLMKTRQAESSKYATHLEYASPANVTSRLPVMPTAPETLPNSQSATQETTNQAK